MAKHSSKIIEFRLPHELYEQVQKRAKKSGFKSSNLFVKELLFSTLETDTEEDFSSQLIEEVGKIWETIEREKRYQRQFRERVDETLTAILKELQKPSVVSSTAAQNARSYSSAQKQSLLGRGDNPLDERYARSRR